MVRECDSRLPANYGSKQAPSPVALQGSEYAFGSAARKLPLAYSSQIVWPLTAEGGELPLGTRCGCWLSGPSIPAVGHQLTVAVTSEFLAVRGIEWLVFGDQIDRGIFRTRPGAVGRQRSSPDA